MKCDTIRCKDEAQVIISIDLSRELDDLNGIELHCTFHAKNVIDIAKIRGWPHQIRKLDTGNKK